MIRRPPRSTLFPTRRSSDLDPRAEGVRQVQRRVVEGGPEHLGLARGLHQPQLQQDGQRRAARSEEHTSELQSRQYLVCRLLLEKKKIPSSPTHAFLPLSFLH